jgi:hypothetical protein
MAIGPRWASLEWLADHENLSIPLDAGPPD